MRCRIRVQPCDPTLTFHDYSDQDDKKSTAILDLQQRLDDKTKNVVDEILQTRKQLKACLDKHEDRRRERIQQVISSLHFPDMQSRRNSIDEAFPETYEWALKEDTSGLRTWLRTGSDIYWVAGKAGSGKSTLMKFLGNDKRTLEHLSEWSGSREDLILIRVECYFWYLGSTLQRSVEGLFRTVLYQILKACPDVVKTLLPERWARTEHDFAVQNSWELKELKTALQSVAHAISQANALTGFNKAPRFCILIDGLDEYNGSHGELVQVLEGLASNGHTKLCVSSRPDNIFVSAFESRKPHLYLQDLTGNDMRVYVEGKLRNAVFVLHSYLDRVWPSSEVDDVVSITHEILRRAEGVFLWVRLAVQSVLRGLDEGDNIATLQKRVLEYPSDLNKFFDSILARIDSVYRFQTSQALYLAYLYADDHDRAAAQSSYLDFELLGRDPAGLQDVQHLSALEPQALSLDGVMSLVYKTRSFLGACCKDLLSLTIPSPRVLRDSAEDPSKLQVQFIHRTVYDYIRSTGYDRVLEQNVPPCFRDGSVFHILNMGKLKYYWDISPPASSAYFNRLVSFSLEHGWKGVDVSFVDGLQSCQPFHQKAWAASLGAAYIALGQHDKFQEVYLPGGSSRQLFEGSCPFSVLTFSPIFRDYIDETLSSRCSRVTDLDNTPSEEYIVSGCVGDGTWTYLRLLSATLGITACRTFPCAKIDLETLSCTLKFSPELTLFEPSDSEEPEAEQFILGRFLESALEPLLQTSIEASADYLQWSAFMVSNTLQHTHDVATILMQRHSDILTRIIEHRPPFSHDDRYGTLWRLITTSKFSQSTQRTLDVLHSPTEWESWQTGLLKQGSLQAAASKLTSGDGGREKCLPCGIQDSTNRPGKRCAAWSDDEIPGTPSLHVPHEKQRPTTPMGTEKASSQMLGSRGRESRGASSSKRVKRLG